MSTALAAAIDGYPPALVRAVADEAARDADRVAAFLAALGLGAAPDRPRHFPATFLLALGAGLRLLDWEANGYAVHREAGLPAARDVLRDALLSGTRPDLIDTALPVRVLGVFVERFAWAARVHLGADLLLDELDPDDDAAAEALAEYLWATRFDDASPASPED